MNNNQSVSRIEFSDCSDNSSDLIIETEQKPKITNLHKNFKQNQIPNLIVSDSASSSTSCGSSANDNQSKSILAPSFVSHDRRIRSSSVHDLRQHNVNYNLLHVGYVGVVFLLLSCFFFQLFSQIYVCP